MIAAEAGDPAERPQPRSVRQQPGHHQVQPAHRKRQQPVALLDGLRAADQAAQPELRSGLDPGHLVQVYWNGQPPAQQLTLVRAQQVAAVRQELPGGTTIEDREIQRQHAGLRRADRAGQHPVHGRQARAALGIGGDHRVQGRNPLSQRVWYGLQVLLQAARLVLTARPARARPVTAHPARPTGRPPQAVQRGQHRLGDRIGADRVRQFPGAGPVARAQFVLGSIADRGQQARNYRQALLNQGPGLPGATRALCHPRPQQQRGSAQGRLLERIQRRQARRPCVCRWPAVHGGGLNLLRHQIQHPGVSRPVPLSRSTDVHWAPAAG